MNKKYISAALGVVFVLSSTVLLYTPTVVHADTGSFAGAADYICALEDADATALSTPGGAYTAGAVLAIYLCTRDPISTGSAVQADTIAFYSGMYQNQGVIKRGVIVSMSGEWTGQDGYDFAYAEDFDLYLTATGVPTNLRCESHDGSGFKYYTLVFTPTSSGTDTLSVICSNRRASSGCLSGAYNCQWGRSFMGLSLDITVPSVPELYGYTLQDKLYSGDFNVNSSRVAILGSGSYSRLPSGDLDLANPDIYLENVLRPYIEETYPEYVYLLPDPEPQPTETLDPSETMPGLPVIELPTVPPPEYDLELPEKMLEGAGFWFTALTEVLEEMGWLAVVIALAVIAIVLYYVF